MRNPVETWETPTETTCHRRSISIAVPVSVSVHVDANLQGFVFVKPGDGNRAAAGGEHGVAKLEVVPSPNANDRVKRTERSRKNVVGFVGIGASDAGERKRARLTFLSRRTSHEDASHTPAARNAARRASAARRYTSRVF